MALPESASRNSAEPRAARALAMRPAGDAGLFLLWLAAVLLAPVWFGANNSAIWGAHAIFFGLLLAALGGRRSPLAVPIRRVRLPLAAIAVVALWAAIQSARFVPAGWRHPVWALASTALGEPAGGAISVFPEAGWVAILWMVTAASVFFMALQFGRDPARARLVLVAIALGGAAISAYGLAIYLGGNKWVLWQPKHAYLDALTATFINRDTFAGYAGTVMTVTFGFLLGEASGLRPLAMAGPVRLFTLLLLILSFALDAAALVLSASRAGAAVALLGIGAVSLLAAPRLHFRRGAVLGAFAAGGLAILVFTAAFGHLLSSRLPRLEQDLAGRLALDHRVVDAIEARPLLGSGFGAFREAFPAFRDASLQQSGRWEYAHNSWLEPLMTLGIPIGLLLWLAVGWIFHRLVAGARRGGRESLYASIATGVFILAAVQSLVDFPVQIQGFAIPLLAVLGAGVAQSWPVHGAD